MVVETTVKQTPLYQQHVDAGGKMVDFSGWSLPVSYGSQLKEHQAVRESAGLFDVSHMTIVDLIGPPVESFLRILLANDVTKLVPDESVSASESSSSALYTCMLTEGAGVIDDLIVYRLSDKQYRLILNAATRDKDIAWIQKQLSSSSEWTHIELLEQLDLALLAIQGPEAVQHLNALFDKDRALSLARLARFSARTVDDWFVARTGYTGEDGFELAIPASDAGGVWNKLIQSGVNPCGLGARDTLRLEAGLNLYGADMDEQVSPLECSLGWTVSWKATDRNFIGRTALDQQKSEQAFRVQVGLQLESRGVLRAGQVVYDGGREIGVVTSGTYSPTLQRSIAMARLDAVPEGQCSVDIRGKLMPASVTSLPFYRTKNHSI